MNDYAAEIDVANPPDNYATGRLANSVVVPGNIVVYGFTAYSTKGSAQFFTFFDASTVPANASVPLFSWPVAANNGVAVSWSSNGRRFKTGLVICNSSTDAAVTIGSADCLFDVQYERLSELASEEKFEAYAGA